MSEIIRLGINCENKNCKASTVINVRGEETVMEIIEVVKNRGWVFKNDKLCCSYNCVRGDPPEQAKKPVGEVKTMMKKVSNLDAWI